MSLEVQPNILVTFLYRMSMEVEGSLVITNVNEDEDAKYQCLAKNVVGTRGSAKAQLSILGKIIDTIWYLWQFFAILASFELFWAALGRYQIV